MAYARFVRLGDMLLKAGVVTELQLNAALAEQSRWSGKLGQILVRMGALSDELLAMALSRQLSLPRIDLDTVQAIPDALRQRIDQAAAEKYRVLPLAWISERRSIQLAMSDPLDVVAVDDLRRILGTRIELFVVGDQQLASAIRRLYGAASSSSVADQRSVDSLDIMDNTGNVRLDAMAPPRLAATQAPPSFEVRVAEVVRGARAVEDLLRERGLIGPEGVLRRRT